MWPDNSQISRRINKAEESFFRMGRGFKLGGNYLPHEMFFWDTWNRRERRHATDSQSECASIPHNDITGRKEGGSHVHGVKDANEIKQDRARKERGHLESERNIDAMCRTG